MLLHDTGKPSVCTLDEKGEAHYRGHQAASAEIADAIPGSELFLYEGLGHGLYEEAPDFLKRVAAFCR